MSVCLALMCRDEAKVIERCLQSCRSLIDTYCIVDTGSTDGTVELIKRTLADIPGEIHEREWVNFAHNRTELMDLARGTADWLLLLDADYTVSGFIPDDLDADAYLLRYDDPSEWWNVHLVRGDMACHFVGPVHEYFQADDACRLERLPSLLLKHHGDSHDNVSPEQKFLKHYEILKAHIEQNPDDQRSVFYMAQTCRDLIPYQQFRLEEAIRWYDQRSNMPGWDEETFYAAFQMGALLLSRDLRAATIALLRAWSLRPSRAEPLYYLGKAYEHAGEKDVAELFLSRAAQIPKPADLLFVHNQAYEAA